MVPPRGLPARLAAVP